MRPIEAVGGIAFVLLGVGLPAAFHIDDRIGIAFTVLGILLLAFACRERLFNNTSDPMRGMVVVALLLIAVLVWHGQRNTADGSKESGSAKGTVMPGPGPPTQAKTSTTATTPAAEPPKGAAKSCLDQDDPRLTFTDSTLLTPPIREQMCEDLSNFKIFMTRLGVPVPTSVLPIKIADSGSGVGDFDPSGNFPYPASLIISEKRLRERPLPIQLYSLYIVRTVLRYRSGGANPSLISDEYGHEAVLYFGLYFSSSFLAGDDSEPWQHSPLPKNSWAEAVWDLRRTFGRENSDILMANALDSFARYKAFRIVESFDAYFRDHLQNGCMVIDLGGKKSKSLDGVLQRHGLLKDEHSGPNPLSPADTTRITLFPYQLGVRLLVQSLAEPDSNIRIRLRLPTKYFGASVDSPERMTVSGTLGGFFVDIFIPELARNQERAVLVHIDSPLEWEKIVIDASSTRGTQASLAAAKL